MTGPEHVAEADLLLTGDDAASCEYGCPHSGCPHVMAHIARAQAHATVAVAVALEQLLAKAALLAPSLGEIRAAIVSLPGAMP